MKRSFADSRQSLTVLFLLLVIAAVFIFIYYTHLQNRKSYLVERNFRELNNISHYIQQRKDGISEAISNTITEINNYKNTDNKTKAENIKSRLKDLITDLDSIYYIESYEDYYNYIYKGAQFRSNGEKLLLDVYHLSDNVYVILSVNNIEPFLEQKKGRGLFDDFFFISTDGKKILQPSSNTFAISTMEKVITKEGSDSAFSILSRHDNGVTITLGDKDYLMFIRPLKASTDDQYAAINTVNKDTSWDGRWTICGIVSADRFNSEASAISSNIILVFITAVALILLAWPLLKLKFISRYGHIRTPDIAITTFSLIFTAAILTFTIMHIFVQNNIAEKVDEQLESISASIHENLKKEICAVSGLLDQATEDFRKDLALSKNPGYYNLFSDAGGYNKHDENTFKVYNPEYKFFTQLHWSDFSGNQKYKFLMNNKSKTPFINLKQREYHQRAMQNNLWNNSCSPEGLFLQPLISLTTGNFSLTLSKREKLINNEEYVGVADFIPISVFSPVLPRGYIFCIIDADGKVLFHSSNDRNLVENFLLECDDPELVSAAIQAHAKEKFTTKYWGKSIKAIITPIEGLPWYSVVMFEKNVINNSSLETISVSVFLLLLNIIPFVVLLFFILILKRGGCIWLWPQTGEKDVYRNLLISYSFFSLVLLLINLLTGDQTMIFLLSWLIPHSALLFSALMIYVKVKKINRPHLVALLILLADLLLIFFLFILPKEMSLLSLTFLIFAVLTAIGYFTIFAINIRPSKNYFTKNKTGAEVTLRNTAVWYSAALTALLLLGIVLPSIGFFNISYKTQSKLYIQQGQLDYYYKLQARNQDIEDFYNRGSYSNAEGLKKERKANQKDIYISSFFSTTYTNKDTIKNPALSWFDTEIIHDVIYEYLYGIGRTGTISRALIKSDTEHYKWNLTDSGLIFTSAFGNIITQIPDLKSAFAGKPTNLILLLFLAACGALLFFSLTRFIVKSFFLVEADDSSLSFSNMVELSAVKTDTFKHNILFLSRNQEVCKEIKEIFGREVINLNEIIVEQTMGDKKKEWIIPPDKLPDISERLFILNGFEYGFRNHEINQVKLSFLEHLVYTRRTAVIIISSIHPLGEFACSEPEDVKRITLNRWKDVLSGFTPMYFKSTLTKPDVITPVIKKKENGKGQMTGQTSESRQELTGEGV